MLVLYNIEDLSDFVRKYFCVLVTGKNTCDYYL